MKKSPNHQRKLYHNLHNILLTVRLSIIVPRISRMREISENLNVKIGQQPSETNNNLLTTSESLLLALASKATNKNSVLTLENINSPNNIENNIKKRRRNIGNMDNTLDGLVARRAETDPNAKLYQTENEVIELPDDDGELKRIETDVDVGNRTCSVCGYKGKWVSEMIRHARVHSGARPYKCKLCSRTSRWKADLIRHVAKAHGIRVISKYSRSKAFGISHNSSSSSCGSPVQSKENDSCNPKVKRTKQQKSSSLNADNIIKNITNNNFSSSFKCLICRYEQESIELMIQHLDKIHSISPFECINCKQNFKEIQETAAHCSLSNNKCTPMSIKINFSPISNNNFLESSSTTSTYQTPTNYFLPELVGLSSPNSLQSESLSPSSTISSARSYEILSTSIGNESSSICNDIMACNDCPFTCNGNDKLLQHKLGHLTPKGPFNYKCIFCNWFAKKRSTVEQHMLLHTPNASDFMSEVEKNLITPATSNDFLNLTPPFEQSFNHTGNLSYDAITLSQQLTSFQKTLSISPLFAAIAAVSNQASPNLPTASNNISPTTLIDLQNSLSTNQSNQRSGNINPISQITTITNPFIAFNLCNILSTSNRM
uniref:C2H2-type domain-containing protein n=1 Tax=Strongyloides venezuelensis TaxID=75913 RepID=A0A0K0F8G9_STRVS